MSKSGISSHIEEEIGKNAPERGLLKSFNNNKKQLLEAVTTFLSVLDFFHISTLKK